MNALDSRCGGAGDFDSGAGRSGKRHHVNLGMRAERRARFGSVAIDHVEHACRHAGGLEHFGPDLG